MSIAIALLMLADMHIAIESNSGLLQEAGVMLYDEATRRRENGVNTEFLIVCGYGTDHPGKQVGTTWSETVLSYDKGMFVETFIGHMMEECFDPDI